MSHISISDAAKMPETYGPDAESGHYIQTCWALGALHFTRKWNGQPLTDLQRHNLEFGVRKMVSYFLMVAGAHIRPVKRTPRQRYATAMRVFRLMAPATFDERNITERLAALMCGHEGTAFLAAHSYELREKAEYDNARHAYAATHDGDRYHKNYARLHYRSTVHNPRRRGLRRLDTVATYLKKYDKPLPRPFGSWVMYERNA